MDLDFFMIGVFCSVLTLGIVYGISFVIFKTYFYCKKQYELTLIREALNGEKEEEKKHG